MVRQIWQHYDYDNKGVIDYAKFCERVMGSRVTDAADPLFVKPVGTKTLKAVGTTCAPAH